MSLPPDEFPVSWNVPEFTCTTPLLSNAEPTAAVLAPPLLRHVPAFTTRAGVALDTSHTVVVLSEAVPSP